MKFKLNQIVEYKDRTIEDSETIQVEVIAVDDGDTALPYRILTPLGGTEWCFECELSEVEDVPGDLLETLKKIASCKYSHNLSLNGIEMKRLAQEAIDKYEKK